MGRKCDGNSPALEHIAPQTESRQPWPENSRQREAAANANSRLSFATCQRCRLSGFHFQKDISEIYVWTHYLNLSNLHNSERWLFFSCDLHIVNVSDC